MPALLEFRGVVERVEEELIPKLFKARIVSEDGRVAVEMDLHKELVVYSEGEKLLVGIYDSLPEYREGEDLVMRAYHVSTREAENAEGVEEHLFSAGGLLFKISVPKGSLKVEPVQLVYIKIARV